jgi:hypothetical protein
VREIETSSNLQHELALKVTGLGNTMGFRSFCQAVFSDPWRPNRTLLKKSNQSLQMSAIASHVWT